jgi:hypothetical protein
LISALHTRPRRSITINYRPVNFHDFNVKISKMRTDKKGGKGVGERDERNLVLARVHSTRMEAKPGRVHEIRVLDGGSQAPKRLPATRSSAARDVGDARRRRLSAGCSSPAPDGPAPGASRKRLPLVRAARVGEDEYLQKACAARRPGAPRGRRARCESVVCPESRCCVHPDSIRCLPDCPGFKYPGAKAQLLFR